MGTDAGARARGLTLTSGTGARSWRIVPRSGTMPVASYRPPFKVRSRHVWMVSFGGFGVAQISMLSQVRCSARTARQAYATRVLSVRLFSAPFLSDFCAKTPGVRPDGEVGCAIIAARRFFAGHVQHEAADTRSDHCGAGEDREGEAEFR